MGPPSSFLVFAPDGRLLAASNSHAEAAHFAASLSPNWLDMADPSPEAKRDNPYAEGPENALRLCGIKPIALDEVLSLTRKQAWDEIEPTYQEVRAASLENTGLSIAVDHSSFVSPNGGLLTSNTKLAKQKDPRLPPTYSLGMALLPEASVFRGKTQGRPPEGMPGVDPAEGPRGATWCSSASKWCKATCLVFSGQNQLSLNLNYVKYARSLALARHPVAFMRLLLTALTKYRHADRIKEVDAETGNTKSVAVPPNTLRFVRLNVLSDIPWEELAPWIFRPQAWHTPDTRKDDAVIDYRGLRFYDYTKVPGRNLANVGGPGGRPVPYDLSFSFSGVNHRHCATELARGRRVVIPFASPQWIMASSALRQAHKLPVTKEEAYYYLNPLPKRMRDPIITGRSWVKVHDGDRSDIRPLDPKSRSGLIVGLRFKPPSIDTELVGSAKAKIAGPFVVNGTYTDTENGPRYVLPVVPTSQPTRQAISGKTADQITV